MHPISGVIQYTKSAGLIALLFLLLSCSGNPEACFITDKESTEPFQSIHFTNCSSDADEFLWDFGDGNSSDQHHPIHAWEDTGTYVVTLNAFSDLKGKASFIAQIIDVEPSNYHFTGLYYDKQDDWMVMIQPGQNHNSVLIYLNGTFLCNGISSQSNLIIEKQTVNFPGFSEIVSGTGLKTGNNLEITLILSAFSGMTSILQINAEQILQTSY
jgi:hypothetical protein